jgi:TonB family protein
MSGQRDSVQLTSDATALVLTTVAALVFITAGHRLLPERVSRVAAPDRPFELALQSAQPEAAPVPPPVPRRTEKRQRVSQPALAPPDSAQYRLQHPHGEVQVRFVLLRNGEPRTVSVVRSSGSAILDQEAVKVVASGHYPPMPEKCFVGETQHTFLVIIEYQPARVTRRLPASESVAA